MSHSPLSSLRPAHPVEAQILARIPENVRERASAVRLMAFDIDGVLTDGRLWYGEHGEITKSFHALDGHGMRMLRECGITVALITGREGPIAARRAAELGIADIHQGVRDKGRVLADLAQKHGLSLEQTGFMGDDLIDLPAFQKAGFTASVSSAPFYITQSVHWISQAAGGDGAARECCDLILAAQGRLGAFLQTGGASTVLPGVPQ
ncbi:phenylphosphate carboxylase subunit delta [Alcaligenaceae bacterium SJ-26]|nr:phenylphosphate carboxylase subunit delta [Alcaligenaceae bacterium SJ-26]